MNPVVHWELFATDAMALASFYAELFGWRARPVPGIDYVLIDTLADAGIASGIATVPDGWRRPIFYVTVGELQPVIDGVEHAGGKTTLPPVTEVVTFAQVADPEGNIIGLLASGDESPVSPGDAPPVSLFHLNSKDPSSLVDFYGGVFGWSTHRRGITGDTASFDVWIGYRGIPGVIGRAAQGPSSETFYAAVEDVDTYLDRARTLGATSASRPTKQSGPVQIAHFMDPEGQTFGLVMR